MQNLYDKLKILADSAKYDVACSTSGVERGNTGKRGNTIMAGCCHSWSADGRCISLLKVLFTNRCVYNCEYCINKRTSDIERTAFEPIELAKLTMEFYRRNYIEGLFLSSAVDISPDYTSERMLEALKILRNDMGFAGYIHTKVIPGTSPELVHALGLVSDRLSVNAELPTKAGLALLAPQKKPEQIYNSHETDHQYPDRAKCPQRSRDHVQRAEFEQHAQLLESRQRFDVPTGGSWPG